MRLDPFGRIALVAGLLVLGACSSSSSNGTGTDAGVDVRVDSYVAPFPDAGTFKPDSGVPSCTDGVKDQNETDIDCGGKCPTCPDGEMCGTNADCQSAICTAGICQELPPPTQCTTTADCTPSTTLCITVSCSAGECSDQPAAVGTTCSDNGGNTCDGNGNCVLTCTTASDCPASTSTCYTDTCTGGVCGTSNAAGGTACTDHGGMVCDGNGTCAACFKAADCPASTTLCETAVCTGGACGTMNAAAGTTCTDNSGKVCNATGVCVACDTASDCAPQASACMVDVCMSNACGATPAPVNTKCTDSGGTVCDAMGTCVACNAPSDCPAPPTCQVNTCTTNTCGTTQAATGATCATGVCSSVGLCVQCNVASDCPTTGATCVANLCVP